jgi:predicted permease
MGRSQRLVRGALVIAQVALAFALLVGSGLAFRAFLTVAATPAGFDPDNLAAASVNLSPAKYDGNDETALAFYREVLARVAAQPGVVSVGANSRAPMSGGNSSGSFDIEGREPWPAGAKPLLHRNVVTPGYFKTMGIPIVRGRDFNDADAKDGRLVMVISQRAAERFFPGEDPIGHRIDLGEHDDTKHLWSEIVGVVGDVRKLGLGRELIEESYAMLAQTPSLYMTIVARTPRPEALLQAMPGIVAAVDPDQAVASPRLMKEDVERTIGTQRFISRLLTAFAAAALLLATLGIFGLVSYTTSQRTRELGIRLALGSSPEGLIAVVMREGLRPLGIGLFVGLTGALVIGRAMAARVPGAAAFDPVLLAVIFFGLGAAGSLASLFPALRATRIPPAVALRYE